MKPATSLYLDLMRFTAAATVFFYHVGGFTGGLFWRAQLYAQTAVVIFFVLSGFVIAHVLATRERSPLDYGASRFARLYSVVIPALLLGAICNTIGGWRSPGLYEAGTHAYRYFATLFMVNEW